MERRGCYRRATDATTVRKANVRLVDLLGYGDELIESYD